MGQTTAKRSESVVQLKLARILAGANPRVLDLFSGCGGLSLGFHAAGFDAIGSVELDELAALTFARNFCDHHPTDRRAILGQPRDITSIEPAELLNNLGYETPSDRVVDVIVGGPPCQAFARVGRAKLREVAEHPEAFKQDPRGNLYLRYLHYVKALSPVAILMENVPDVLNYGGHNIAEEVSEVLDELGYESRYTMLNAVYYGVPEMRERMFLVAYRKEIRATHWFPTPTHWIDLPRGYHGSRSVALKTIRNDLFSTPYYIDPPEAIRTQCVNAVTAREAISDLPRITAHLHGKLRRGARRFDQLVGYKENETLTPYQRAMRTWPHFEASGGINDHVIRYLPRDYAIFRRMRPGDQYPEAYAHAKELFNERLRAVERKAGRKIHERSKVYIDLWDATVPPYDPGKFPNKWRKMEANKPARTLMAHLGKDGYSHIHYDSSQARTISVREAARLQSFPDGFVFEGTMNPAFRQIGNAVPPLLATAIAKIMKHELCAGEQQDEAKASPEAFVSI